MIKELYYSDHSKTLGQNPPLYKNINNNKKMLKPFFGGLTLVPIHTPLI